MVLSRILVAFLIIGISRGISRRELWEDLSLPTETHRIELQHGDARNLKTLPSNIAPIYQGYGTHFAYIYVGTPAQRQSVILDTGSHLTAFPCAGCKNCGKHTDSYYDPKDSSSATTVMCKNHLRSKDAKPSLSPCTLSQSYAEGSSWKAVKMKDKVWLGGLTTNLVKGGKNYSVNFDFGCQSSETGLFRTQLADGIMGMSAAVDTLPHQLFVQNVTKTRTFAMCFRVGGGIVTLGGVDQHIHTKPNVIQYAAMVHPTGSNWYTVYLHDILMVSRNNGEKSSINAKVDQLNRGKGVIVDSGTTDTYLPSVLNAKFLDLFKKLSGLPYSNKNNKLTQAQLDQLPDIVFVLTGAGNDGKVEVVMPWSNYVEKAGNGIYAFRIYLSEGSGSVLGANFMNGQNVIFDRDNNRIGFARSSCNYENFVVDKGLGNSNLTDVVENTTEIAIANNFGKTTNSDSGECIPSFVPLNLCSAKCDHLNAKPAQYVSTGWQKGVDSCKINITKLESNAGITIPSDAKLPDRQCHELCDQSTVVSGSRPMCIYEEWSECTVDKTSTDRAKTQSCSQSRHNFKLPKALEHSHKLQQETTCIKFVEKRPCYIDACPVLDGDYIVYVDMKVQIPSAVWSYAYTNVFISALSEMFKIPAGSIDLLNNAGDHDLVPYVKLHFELRLTAANFNHDMQLLTEVAEAIPIAVKSPQFSLDFIHLLNFISDRDDRYVDFSRYGWMRRRDLTVTNALVLPLGNARPIVMPVEEEHHSPLMIYFLIGIALGAMALFCCLLWLHFKLRQDHDDLSKEKIQTSTWRTMFNTMTSRSKRKVDNQRYLPVSNSELELNSMREKGNKHQLDDVIDDDDNMFDN